MYHEFWTASLVLFALGLLLAVLYLVVKLYGARNAYYPAQAEARVVDFVIVPRTGQAALSEFRNRQAAVFEFFADGKPVKVTDTSDRYPCPYRLNQRVRVCYDPAAPQNYRVIPPTPRRFLPPLLGALSVLCVVGGCVLFLMYAERGRL